MNPALWIARVFEAYALLGFLFAILFVTKGVDAIDPAARDARLSFRLMILPGAALLWPFLAVRWCRR